MRKILSKQDLVTPSSVKFLYDTKLGNLVLFILTRRWISKLVGKYLDSRLSCHKIKKYVKKHNDKKEICSFWIDGGYKKKNRK